MRKRGTRALIHTDEKYQVSLFQFAPSSFTIYKAAFIVRVTMHTHKRRNKIE
jgi:hypothetical protein